MKAVELTVVFEDDEGKTHVLHGEEEIAERAVRLLRAVDHPSEDPTDSLPCPVLRKVTEATGHVEDYPADAPYISGASEKTMLASVIPDECRKDCTEYRFRFVCEAVRVPDPERDAKDLSGLPGKDW